MPYGCPTSFFCSMVKKWHELTNFAAQSALPIFSKNEFLKIGMQLINHFLENILIIQRCNVL